MKLKILMSVCAAMLAGCGTAALHDQLQKSVDNDPFIGKDFWVPLVNLCEKPDIVRGNCTHVQGPPDVHLKIDGEVMEPFSGSFYYHVALDDGRTGYTLSTLVLKFGTQMDPAECK